MAPLAALKGFVVNLSIPVRSEADTPETRTFGSLPVEYVDGPLPSLAEVANEADDDDNWNIEPPSPDEIAERLAEVRRQRLERGERADQRSADYATRKLEAERQAIEEDARAARLERNRNGARIINRDGQAARRAILGAARYFYGAGRLFEAKTSAMAALNVTIFELWVVYGGNPRKRFSSFEAGIQKMSAPQFKEVRQALKPGIKLSRGTGNKEQIGKLIELASKAIVMLEVDEQELWQGVRVAPRSAIVVG